MPGRQASADTYRHEGGRGEEVLAVEGDAGGKGVEQQQRVGEVRGAELAQSRARERGALSDAAQAKRQSDDVSKLQLAPADGTEGRQRSVQATWLAV